LIRSVVVDLDGTLLNSSKIITRKTGQLLLRYLAQGIRVIIATARHPLLSAMIRVDKEFGELLKLPDGVFYNGGCILIQNKRRCITMDADSVRRVVENLRTYRDLMTNTVLQHPNEIHSIEHGLTADGLRTFGLTEDRIIGIDQGLDIPTVKIFVYLTEAKSHDLPVMAPGYSQDTLEQFREMYAALRATTTFQTYLSDNGTVIQMVGNRVNKLNGIKEVLSADK
jgi:hydroxymethylpyrimidine pyrophosphatase-like HAD family hydrolase